MGREIKEVPTDFEWPIGETWKGYEPPDVRNCPDCDVGVTGNRAYIEAVAQKLLGGVRCISENGVGRQGKGLILRRSVEIDEKYAALTEGLCGREPMGLGGHDALDRHAATKAIIEAAGLDPGEWGICDTCGGSAVHPEDEGTRDDWEPVDPPQGSAYQVWETVSEGSPITPVYETKRGMIDHLSKHGTEWDDPFPRERAARFIEAKWAPSMVMSQEHGVESGTEALDHSG